MDTQSHFKCNEFVYQDTSLPREVLERFFTFRLEDNLTDVEIEVGSESFRCHRVILAAASPYYRALFQHDQRAKQDSKITLQHTSPSVFREILEFVYTSKLSVSKDNAMGVLELADFLQFRGIVECCAEFLLQNITTSSCLSIFQLADAHSCKALAHAAKAFIKENFQDILMTVDFVHLSYQMLCDILSDQAVVMQSEEKLLHALCTWIDEDQTERLHCMESLLEFVHWDDVSKDSIEEGQTTFQFLKTFLNDREIRDRSGQVLEDTVTTLVEAHSEKSSSRPLRHIVIVPENANKHKPSERHLLIYSPRDDKWSRLTDLPFGDTVQLLRTSVLDNCIYVTGGEVSGVPTNRVLKYDVSADAWSEVAPMHHARFNHAVTEAMGCLYVFGGETDISKMGSEYDIMNTLERYDPQTNKWVMLKAMSSMPPDVPAGFHGMYSVANCDLVHLGDFLFVIGGSQTTRTLRRRQARTSSETPAALRHPTCMKHLNVECYDLRENTWSFLPEMSHHLAMQSMSLSHGTCFAFSGFLLLIDEDTKGKKMKLYDPVRHKLWDFLPTQGQHRFGSYLIQDGWLYAAGGMSAFDRMLRGHDLVHRTPAMGTTDVAQWEMLDPLPFALSHYTAVTVSKHAK